LPPATPVARSISSSGRRTTASRRRRNHLLASAELETGDAAEALEHLRRGRELFADSLTDVDDAKFAIEEARALLGLDRLKAAAKAASRALELIECLDPQDRR